MGLSSVKSLLKQTYEEWTDDQIPRLAAALAYYTAFSLAPLLVVVIAVAGIALGQAEVQDQIIAQLRGLLGEQGAGLVATMLESAMRPREGSLALVLSFVAVILGASGLVRELKTALNTVWEVAPRPGGGLWGMVRERFLSFALVLGVGFLLLVTLVISAALAALQARFHSGEGAWATAFQMLGFAVDFVLTAFVIALIFKFVPDVRLGWRDVAPGAVVTAVLFTGGKFAIGAYLGRAAVGSAYGAAGSLAIVLLWVYYSAQILLLGAEFTQVWVRRRRRWIEPTPNADSTRTSPREGPAPAEAPDKRAEPPPLPLPSVPPVPVMRVHMDAEPDPTPRVSPGYLGGLALGFLTGLVRERLRIRSRH